jgi:hypothetical protein
MSGNVLGGSAETDARLQIGDQILEVNGTQVYNLSHLAITDLLKSCGDRVCCFECLLHDDAFITAVY